MLNILDVAQTVWHATDLAQALAYQVIYYPINLTDNYD